MSAKASNIKEIFFQAVELSSPDERAEYLDRACGPNNDIRRRVEALIVAHERPESLLDHAAVECESVGAIAATVEMPPLNETVGSIIGPYKLMEQIGEGGMGVVYVAQQDKPVRRKVALKIIKPGMDTKQVIARFEAERQALALMDHPNIAKVLDAGTTSEVRDQKSEIREEELKRSPLTSDLCPLTSGFGRPYFVMELVRGITITQYCDTAQLTTRQRLDLFIKVCRAIQHAHQKGIIHRDIKPTNVLVTQIDGAAVPKVIDFGVAKAISQKLTEQTLYTAHTQMIGTPLYMSPEQAQMSGVDVDTRSDVYSLGVLLYELLTGSTPFDKQTLNDAGYDEMRRIIREEEPPRPSGRISTLQAEALSTLSVQRNIDPHRFSRQIQGELDWIVMKALEKDRTRRYESASAFAADIERYLNNEPVEACPPSTAYRLRKFARRNKTTITTTGLVAVALVIGIFVSVWQAIEANDARQLANHRFVEADKQRQSAVRAAKLAQQNEEFSRQLVYAADVKLAAQAWQSGDVRRFTDLLDRHTQIAGKTDRRGFEWWYLRQFGTANFRNIATQTGGSCVVRFSPDGKYLVTGRADGTVCIWDGHSFERIAMLRGHEFLVRGIDFAPDGIRMASIGDDGMIRIWDLSEQKLIRSFQAHSGHGFRVFFLMDGKTLASSGEDTSVRLWNVSTGEAVGELEGYARTNERAAMDRSPDGRLCASGNPNGNAYVWDVETHKRLCKLDLGFYEGARCWACCLCFSPDGQLVAVGTDQNLIRLCDARTGEQIATFTGHQDDIQAVTFHPSGSLLASSDMAGVIRLWPLDSFRNVDHHDFGRTDKWPPYFQGHSARAWSLDFSPDGTRLVSASKDGTVRSWSGREQTTQHIRETGDESNAVTFVSQGSELLIAGDNNIRVWNRQADEIRPFGETFNEYAMCVAVSPDGATCVTGHREGIIRFWSRETGRLKKTLTGHEDTVDQIVFSPDGRMLATGSWDGTAKLWDMASGEQRAEFDMPHAHCYDVAFSPDGKLLACSSGDDAMLFDVASRKRLHLLRGHQNSANCVAFSPGGRLLATGSDDRTIRLWNVETGEVQHVIAAQREKIYSLAFSPDGRTIASGSRKGTIAFSHVETGRFLFDTKVGNRKVRCLQFSPDGKILAATVNHEGVILLHAPRTETNDPAKPGQLVDISAEAQKPAEAIETADR